MLADGFCSNEQRGVCVPAFAGTTGERGQNATASFAARKNDAIAMSPVEQLPQHVVQRLAVLLRLRRRFAWRGRGNVAALVAALIGALVRTLTRPLAQPLLQQFAERLAEFAGQHI